MLDVKGRGTYVLVIAILEDAEIEVGSLGQISFCAGYYLYVGSALGGLAARLGRHMAAQERLHWHIDYVLASGRLVEIWYRTGDARYECEWAQALAKSPLLRPTPAALGASDCACHTHLFHCLEHPSLGQLRPRLTGGEQIIAVPVTLADEHQRVAN